MIQPWGDINNKETVKAAKDRWQRSVKKNINFPLVNGLCIQAFGLCAGSLFFVTNMYENMSDAGSQGSISDTVSIFSASIASFNEKDFQLPDLETNNYVDFESEKDAKRQLKLMNSVQFEIRNEKKLLRDLDELAKRPDEHFSRRRGVVDRPNVLRAIRGRHEGESELKILKNVLSRKPGDLEEKMTILQSLLEGTFEGDPDEVMPPTIDHPKLGSLEEKLEDLRQEEIEHWCYKHGTTANEKYTNIEKRMLRKWFQALDYDGSGEVNVEELQDPMLSSGILKTREQVVRVLANVDKNNTLGIDFEEFLLALSANKLADQRKIKKLQQMSADPYFDTDTLITAERRGKLIKSILRRCEERQKAIEKLYKKYDKPKLTKKERDQFQLERERLEEQQSKSIYLHLKYVHALDGVIAERKKFYEAQEQDKQLEEEIERRKSDVKSFYKTVADVRLSSNSRAEVIERLSVSGSLGGATRLKPLDPINETGSSPGSSRTGRASAIPVLGTELLNMVRAKKDTTIDDLRANPYKIYSPIKPKQIANAPSSSGKEHR
jgi:hypothetical protein